MARPQALANSYFTPAQAALTRGIVGRSLAIGGLRLLVGDLPLFRRGAGGLLQALRVGGEVPEGRAVRLAVREGDVELDHAVLSGPGHRVATLFVPEIAAPTALTLEVRAGDAPPERAPVEIAPQRKWRVFVAPYAHLDIGYTDPQDIVLLTHLEYLDAVVDLAAATSGWPDDARFRWNVEANWVLQHWLRCRPAARRRAFLDLARAGRIEVTALPYVLNADACSPAELAHLLRFADRLREEYGLPVVTAMQTDVPGMSIGLANLLADAGIRNLGIATNYAGRTTPFLGDGQRLTRPFRWRTDGGKELLVWHTDSVTGASFGEGMLLGLAGSYAEARAYLPEYLGALAERGYPFGRESFGWWSNLAPPDELTRAPYPYDILHLCVQGAGVANAPPTVATAEIARRWNEEWAYPRLRVATERDFFAVADAELRDRSDTFSGDWTNFWVDGIGSGARLLAMNRRAQALAPVAATLHTLADRLTDEEGHGWEGDFDACHDQIGLFDEHTWTAFDPWGDTLEERKSGAIQWQRKAAHALVAHDSAQLLVERGMARLGQALGPRGGHPGVVVALNPAPWVRSDRVDVLLPAARFPPGGPIRLIDEATGQPVPIDTGPQYHEGNRTLGRRLRFIARDVPPLGYRRYLVEPGGEVPTIERRDGAMIENERYRIEVDPRTGALLSLLDRATGRELVERDSPFGFGQYVYDQYAAGANFNHLSSRIGRAGIWMLGSRTGPDYGVVTEHVRTPIGQRLTVRSRAEGVEWLENTWDLPDGVGRLDLALRLQKRATPAKESVYVAFPFRLDRPRRSWELAGRVDADEKSRIPGSAAHMRAIRHWVALEDAAARIGWATRDAPLVQFGTIHLPYPPFIESSARREADAGTIFSWPMNNIWDTNFPDRQGGETVFRYAIAIDGREADARRLGMEAAASLARPLIGALLPPGTVGDLAPTGGLILLDGGALDLVSLAPSRRGDGLVALIASLEDAPVEARLRVPALQVRRARAGTFLERNLREVPVTDGEIRFTIAPGELRAVVFEPDDR